MELSLSTFSAIAALMGAATFALISDIAARSGSSSPAALFRSSLVSCLYSTSSCLPIRSASLRALRDVAGLLGVRIGERVVGEDVRCDSRVDGRSHVRIAQRHRCALRQFLTGELVQLLACQLVILLGLLAHETPSRYVDCVMSPVCCAFAIATEW